jgi:acetyl coenzyme A synthetase (ADP forming)-like protein
VSTSTAVYPAHRAVDVALRDGSTARVRPVRSDDHDALRHFFEELSLDSRSLRFFGAGINLEWAARWAADVDYLNSYGVVVTTGAEERLIGHAAYVRIDDESAEVAFEIADSYQGKGLGTILLAHLAEAADEADIPIFVARIMPENHRMIEVFRESGFPAEIRSGSEGVEVTAPTSSTPEAIERFDSRERISAQAALAHVLEPRSVAVIGASRRRGTVGGELFHNLIEGDFEGPVYPVNPAAAFVQSVPAYSSLAEVPGDVEMAVIAVPAGAVLGAAEQCAAKGVKAIVVISAGFAEGDGDGQKRQRRLVELCRAGGMRLVGPNCLGVLNTARQVRLNATFGHGLPPSGSVGFMSQSGALGLAVIDRAAALSLGLSSFVSVGNKADVSGNDLLEYWEDDPLTKLIVLYLESFGNPRKFARIARRVGRRKPIVAVKSGRSAAGARAAASHTGALLGAGDVNVDSLFRQSGVIRTDTLGELFDVASLLASQPLPQGRRVAVLTNSGGPGIMCADACEAEGLELPQLSESTRDKLRAFLASEASLGNPVDMIATASPGNYARALAVLAADPEVDAVIAIYTPVMGAAPDEVARAIAEAAGRLERQVPVLAVHISPDRRPDTLRAAGVPVYDFPEEAVRALARAARYREWRDSPHDPAASPAGIHPERAAAVISAALAGGGPRWLRPDEVAELLASYGITGARQRLAGSPTGAGHAARALGGPVAVKAVAPALVHKTDAGAVRLGLAGSGPVQRAAREMEELLEAQGHEVDGFLVQEMLAGGVEMLVGVVSDPVFGPVVACGAGGTTAELLKDAAARITPLTDADPGEMLRSLASFPLLDGYRGAPKTDVGALEDLIRRVGALADNHPEVLELECNPVIVTPDGAVAVDARARVAAAAPRRPWPAVEPA